MALNMHNQVHHESSLNISFRSSRMRREALKLLGGLILAQNGNPSFLQ